MDAREKRIRSLVWDYKACGKPLYLCNPLANIRCAKAGCIYAGGACYLTTDARTALHAGSAPVERGKIRADEAAKYVLTLLRGLDKMFLSGEDFKRRRERMKTLKIDGRPATLDAIIRRCEEITDDTLFVIEDASGRRLWKGEWYTDCILQYAARTVRAHWEQEGRVLVCALTESAEGGEDKENAADSARVSK